jgi:hypothetical protein
MRKLFAIYILLTIQGALFAQEKNHLPYSIFGIGEINSKGFTRNMAMGRSGIALSSGRYLNNLNPASYHSIDSISFFFDFGFSADFVKYKTAADPVQHGYDGNVQNVAMGFRITPHWAASIGLAPYSTVGYKITTEKYIEGTTETFEAEMKGNGGLNQFYLHNSYVLFNRLSLGVNLTYLFGSIKLIETDRYSRFSDEILTKQTSYLNKVYADFGFQYFFPVKKNLKITLGGVFGNSHKLNFKKEISIIENGSLVEENLTSEGSFDFPMYIGGGIAVQYKNKLIITSDYLFHDWSGTPSDNPNYSYVSYSTFKFGIEYIPGQVDQLGYFGNVSYRAGYYYEGSYLEINKTSITNNGISFGLGFPFMQNRTSINVAYNLGVHGTINNNLIKETYNSFMLSLTLHDWWFIKRKYD